MSTEPTKGEVKEQVDRLCNTALSQRDQQARLLRRLIDHGARKGKEILGLDTRQLVSSLRETLKRYYRELPPEAPDRVVIEIPIGRGTSYRPLCSYRNTAKIVDVLATFPEWPTEIRQRIEDCQRKLVICITGWSNLDSYLRPIKEILRNGREVEVAFWNPDSDFGIVRVAYTDPDSLKDTIAHNFMLFYDFQKRNPKLNLTVHSCEGWGSVALFWIDDLIYFSMYWARGYTVHGPHFLVSANSTTGKFLQQEYKAMIEAKNKGICGLPESKTSQGNA